MQKALGLAPAVGWDWIQWMRRDQWFGLSWCLPGVIRIASAVWSPGHGARFGGLVRDQWAGILVAAVRLIITTVPIRKVTADGGRPAGLGRELKRINGLSGEGWWSVWALGLQAVVYAAWSRHDQVGLEPFWAGFFLVTGTTCLVSAFAACAWLLHGWAIPLLGYRLCVPLAGLHSRANGVLFGVMFIAIALSFSSIATLQIRTWERPHDTH